VARIYLSARFERKAELRAVRAAESWWTWRLRYTVYLNCPLRHQRSWWTWRLRYTVYLNCPLRHLPGVEQVDTVAALLTLLKETGT